MANDNRAIPGLESVQDQVVRDALRTLRDQVNVLQDKPRSGTLQPDQRPKLSFREAGSQFYSTDFNRIYTWTGSVWEDGQNQPARGHVAWFHDNPEPLAGWVLCDGNRAYRSTATGNVQLFKTPNTAPNGELTAWMRV